MKTKLIFTLALIFMGSGTLNARELVEVTFEFRTPGPEKAEVVYVTGDFAGWSPTAHRMTYFEAEDIWRKTLKLKEGRHLYKFVIDGTDWHHDPANPLKEDDGHGGFNSILKVGEAFKVEFNETIGDGVIREEGLGFVLDDIRYFNPYRENRIRIMLRTAANDVESVKLYVTGAEEPVYELFRFVEGPRFDYFVGHIRTVGDDITFHFVVRDADTVKYYGEKGLFRENASAGDFISKDTFAEFFHTPEWARHVVWYQIMIDRFRNANPANDPEGALSWTRYWFRPTEREQREGFYHVIWDRRFGGDLTGVREKLSYLSDLGITAIYFNPVFEAPSPHKYDASCFIHIDDNFYQKGDIDKVEGSIITDPATWQWTPTDIYFLKFIEAAHEHGIRVVIDGVWNHVGKRFAPFADLMERGKESPYKDWFVVTCWEEFENYAHLGRGYEGWAGFGGLPVFKEDESGPVPPVRDYIFNVTRRWMNPGIGDFAGIDGWRLDVPMCVASPFWRDWRNLVRELNPDALLIGEIWGNAEGWLRGDKFDSVMNYQLAKILVDYFIDKDTRISAGEFDRRVRELILRHPHQATLVQYNLTNSHDTDRIASMIRNPDRPFDAQNRLQYECGKNYDISKPTESDFEILRLIWTFKFSFPGAPAIYYGDEVGMWGADDPNNRKPMWWEDHMPYHENEEYEINNELRSFLRRLIAIRNTYPALRTGRFYPVRVDNEKDIVIYKRVLGDEVVHIVVNNSDKSQEVTIDSRENLWDVINTEGEIKRVNRAQYSKVSLTHAEETGIFIDGNHTINFLSIEGEADYRSCGGVVTVKVGPREALFLANRAYTLCKAGIEPLVCQGNERLIAGN